MIGAPLVSLVAGWGDRAVYLLLAFAALPAAVWRAHAEAIPTRRREVSRSRSNRVLLAALFLLTVAGAGLFVFEAIIGGEVHRLDPVAVSLAFSLNAAFGLVGARLASRHSRPGWWLLSAGPAALLTVVDAHPVLFFAGMFWWGFAFWMGLPGVLQMLAARSLEPDERAGDAQGVMAVGRAFGPIVGGGLVDAGAFATLGLVAGSGVALSGLMVIGVQEGRDRLPPTDPRVTGMGRYG
jgi:DHA1 family inner membrane transport protein